ncbi:MAG: CHC2 zinc finger domain-containing protein [Nitrospirota bacterium]
MAGFIPEEIIEEVRNRIDLVEVISDYVLLKKSGENYKGLCPFHVEKTPSFTVNPRKGIFHCFGCGVGGNVYSFLMKVETMEFVDAVKHLAARCSVAIPEIQGSKQIQSKDTLYKINELAAKFYEEFLWSQTGKKVLDYLKGRKLSDETIKKFRLGYAPDVWDKLLNMAVGKGYSKEKICEAGLILPREGEGYYDRFRNRVIYPIISHSNQIVGFGARVLDDSLPDSEFGIQNPKFKIQNSQIPNPEFRTPKYINSPETPVYQKSKILYGLNFAKDAIRKTNRVIIVEGYMDVISLSQTGFENVVATSGTAFTQDQVRLLKRYCEEVYVLFDPDAAGIQATLRGLDLLMEQEMGVKVVSLPEKIDPADFVSRFSPQEFLKTLEKASELLEYRFEQCLVGVDINTTSGRIKALENIMPTISKTVNPVQRKDFIKKVAETLRVDEEIILSELKKRTKPSLSTTEYLTKQEEGLSLAEKGLIKFMLENEAVALQISQEIKPEDFSNPLYQKIFKVIIDLLIQKKSITPERIIDSIDDNAKNLITSILFQKEMEVGEKERIINDCIKRVKENVLKKRMFEIQKVIGKGEDDEQLLRQYKELKEQMSSV